MYSLNLQREFSAQHFLIGGDWGLENELHSHQYRIEIRLRGEELNEFGYLVDIGEVEGYLTAFLRDIDGAILNELPEFEGLNPSLENFARITLHTLAASLTASNLSSLEIRIWEDRNAWASYTTEY